MPSVARLYLTIRTESRWTNESPMRKPVSQIGVGVISQVLLGLNLLRQQLRLVLELRGQ
jgi:hypothetical protein